MILNRKQLDKLFQITQHFREINTFEIEAEDSETIRVTFSLFEDTPPTKSDVNIRLV